MPIGVYERKLVSLETLHKKRTGKFFQSEFGKKWFNYHGNVSQLKDYQYDMNQWRYQQRRLKHDPNYKPRITGYKSKKMNEFQQRRRETKEAVPEPRRVTPEERQERAAISYKKQCINQQEKIMCTCGLSIRRGYMSVHIHTKKHINAEQELQVLKDLPPPPQEWLDYIESLPKKLNIVEPSK